MNENIIIRKLDIGTNQWVSVLKGAGLAVLGAAVTYVGQNITSTDFGQYSYIIIPITTVILNVLQKVVLNPATPPATIHRLDYKDQSA
jgi:uncharacterized membrane protein AbrB (regulator of aidB expression)